MASILTLDFPHYSIIININNITKVILENNIIRFTCIGDNDEYVAFNDANKEVLGQLFEIILEMLEQVDNKHAYSKRLKITRDSIEEVKDIWFINK